MGEYRADWEEDSARLRAAIAKLGLFLTVVVSEPGFRTVLRTGPLGLRDMRESFFF